MIDIEILNQLNAPNRNMRIVHLKELLKTAQFPPMVPHYVNNHIHTTYSFSPYSPTAAVFAARMEGLSTAGIVDHDAINGAPEFIEAGQLTGIPVTIGMECRASMSGTRLENRRTNNPDQVGISYMTLQGIPHNQFDRLDAFFSPYREYRNARNIKMVARINDILQPYGISLDYDRDVLPLSEFRHGGGVTERHLMYALALSLIARYGKGETLTEFLQKLAIPLSTRQNKQLMDTAYPFYAYDLLGILKSAYIPQIFIPAVDECPAVQDLVTLANETGAILCYAYLGDVNESVTGDKIAQKFEDDYLEEIFLFMREYGIHAITYMPTRNTANQQTRLRSLCEQYRIFQISGEDINSPRQNFAIKAMENPALSNLIDATWKLIDYENGKGKII
jgi:hypothetical protein